MPYVANCIYIMDIVTHFIKTRYFSLNDISRRPAIISVVIGVEDILPFRKVSNLESYIYISKFDISCLSKNIYKFIYSIIHN